ncbi:MAG: alginate export family protein [Kiritimatiellae bacterium]|nr:alginate export family protein [Kiritimatiellia bacterium]
MKNHSSFRLICSFFVFMVTLFIFFAPARAEEAIKEVKELDWSGLPAYHHVKSKLGDTVFSIGGSLRLRYEYVDDFNVKEYVDTQDQYVLERFRLECALKTMDGIQAFVQFQDAHSIDCRLKLEDFKGTSPLVNEFDLRQAYLQWTKIEKSPFGFKVGRQAISYRDNRVFGPGEWGNVGRYTWDAAMLKYEDSYIQLDAFYAKRIFYRPTEFFDEYFPYSVYAGYGQVKKLPLKLDLFYVYKYNRNDENKYSQSYAKERRHSLGFYLEGKVPLHGKDYSLNYSGLCAYQTGRYPTEDKDISSYGAYVNLGLDFNLFIPQGFWVKYTYGSGDKNSGDDKVQTFDGIFGAIDLYYGRMNMFAWSNIEDYQLTYELKPVNGLKIIADYHWFRVDENEDAWYYGTGKSARTAGNVSATQSRALGTELDVFAVYKANKFLEFQLGYCHFNPGTVIKKSGFHEKSNFLIFQTFYQF